MDLPLQPSLFDNRPPPAIPCPFLPVVSTSPSGPELAEQGMNQVLRNAGSQWIQTAMAAIVEHWSGRIGTAEDFRFTCQSLGLQPHSSGAWGALTRTMLKMNKIKRTGEWRTPRDPMSHGRQIPAYFVH